MKKAILVILAVCFFCVAAIAAAGTISTMSWSASTTYMDGSIITETLSYKVYCGRASGMYTLSSSATSTSSPISSTISSTQPDGYYYCAVTALSSLYSSESGYSTELSLYKSGSSFLPTGKVPTPPTNLPMR